MELRSYRLVIEGELDGHFAGAFEGMALKREVGTTILTGPVRDQATFKGAERVAGLGLTLLSAKPLEDSEQQ
jgi:hypothetical protein